MLTFITLKYHQFFTHFQLQKRVQIVPDHPLDVDQLQGEVQHAAEGSPQVVEEHQAEEDDLSEVAHLSTHLSRQNGNFSEVLLVFFFFITLFAISRVIRILCLTVFFVIIVVLIKIVIIIVEICHVDVIVCGRFLLRFDAVPGEEIVKS